MPPGPLRTQKVVLGHRMFQVNGKAPALMTVDFQLPVTGSDEVVSSGGAAGGLRRGTLVYADEEPQVTANTLPDGLAPGRQC